MKIKPVLAWAAEDRIVTRDGKEYRGNILFHNDTQYYIAVGDKVERVNLTDIDKLELGPKVPASPAYETPPIDKYLDT